MYVYINMYVYSVTAMTTPWISWVKLGIKRKRGEGELKIGRFFSVAKSLVGAAPRPLYVIQWVQQNTQKKEISDQRSEIRRRGQV